jgi:hypothetical protein
MQTPSADGRNWEIDRVPACYMCVQCSQPIAKPKRCKSCGIARYCSRECQVAHWDTHKFPCKKRGGREGYLEALEVGFHKLASWQSGLCGGHNQADEIIRTLTDTLAAAKAIGDAEGERYLSDELADRCQEHSESVGGRILGRGGSKEEAAAKVANLQSRSAVFRERAAHIEAVLSGKQQPEEKKTSTDGVPSGASKTPAPAAPADKERDFAAAPTFSGARAGWVFKTGEFGLGYYCEQREPASQQAAASPEEPLPAAAAQQAEEPAPAPRPDPHAEAAAEHVDEEAEDRAMLEELD